METGALLKLETEQGGQPLQPACPGDTSQNGNLVSEDYASSISSTDIYVTGFNIYIKIYVLF